MIWNRFRRQKSRRNRTTSRRLASETLEARQLLAVDVTQVASLIDVYEVREPQAEALTIAPTISYDSTDQIAASVALETSNAVVAGDPDGDHVVIRQQRTGDRYGWDLFGQRYSNDGRQVGSAFRVNEQRLGAQVNPQVAMSADGSFTVAFQSEVADRGWEIMARSYDANGEPVGTEEFVINKNGTGDQQNPSIEYIDPTTYVVAWDGQGVSTRADQNGIFAQRVADGGLVGHPIHVNFHKAGVQSKPSVAVGPEGFTVAWQSNVDDESGISLRSFMVDDDGDLSRTREVAIHNNLELENEPTIATNPDVTVDPTHGSVFVAWQSQEGGSTDAEWDVRAQLLKPNLTAQADPFTVSQTTVGDQIDPTVTHADRNFFVAWQGRGVGDGNGVFLREFRSDLQAQTDEILVNPGRVSGIQSHPHIASSGNGFEIVWDGRADANRNGIFSRSFRLNHFNRPPSISHLSDAYTRVGVPYSFELNVYDPEDVPVVRVHANNGATVEQDESDPKKYTVIPAAGFEGRINVTITARDQVSPLVRSRFTLTAAEERPPAILLNGEYSDLPTFFQAGSEASEFTLDLTVLDVDTELDDQRVTRIVNSDGLVRISDDKTKVTVTREEGSSNSVQFTLFVFDGTYRANRSVSVSFTDPLTFPLEPLSLP